MSENAAIPVLQHVIFNIGINCKVCFQLMISEK